MEIFNLPDVGEGLTEADIAQWRVNVGDTVAVNDVLVEIETAKSLVELPSPYAGTVAKHFADEGATVNVDEPLIGIATEASPDTATEDDDAPAQSAGPAQSAEPAKDEPPQPSQPSTGPDTGTLASLQATPADAADAAADTSGTSSGDEPQALVGSGPKADRAGRRRRTSSPSRPGAPTQPGHTEAPVQPTQPPQPPHPPQPESAEQPSEPEQSGQSEQPEQSGSSAVDARPNRLVSSVREGTAGVANLWQRVLAKPPVRRVAKELGVDLNQVTPTGQYGEVTRTDVENYLKKTEVNIERAPSFWMPDTGDNEHRTERIQVKGVRKATARAVTESYRDAPHVSIYVDVDASRTMEFVNRLKSNPDFEGVKVTPLLILAKAIIWAAARNPHVNATWTDDEILVKHYMNLGIAAATPRGLLVPNVKNANELSLRELALALTELAKRARDGKTQPAEMQDGTISITNIGALGIDTGAPIINGGEVAIVAFGTIRQKPWVVSGEVIPRWITTLGGSFDHRVVDGDLSARFMADVAAIMEEPALLLE